MRQRKKTEMYPLVKKWQQSGQSKLAFSKSHSLKAHTFHYWVKKYEMEHNSEMVTNSRGKFIPLAIEKSQTEKMQKHQIALAYPNGVRLELNEQVSIDYLSALINLGGHV